MNILRYIQNYFTNYKLPFAFIQKVYNIVKKQLTQNTIEECGCQPYSCNSDFKRSLEKDFIKYGIPVPYREHIYTIIKNKFKCKGVGCCGTADRPFEVCEPELRSVVLLEDNILLLSFINSAKYSVTFENIDTTYFVSGVGSTIEIDYNDLYLNIVPEELLILQYDIEDKVCGTISIPVFVDTFSVVGTGQHLYDFENENFALFAEANTCVSGERTIIFSHASGITTYTVDNENLTIDILITQYDIYSVVTLLCNGVVYAIHFLTIRED